MTGEMKLLTDDDCQKLALYLGITLRTADILARMYNSQILTRAEIAEQNLTKRPENVILRLRSILEGHGVEIYAKHGTGYWIDNTGRANVQRLLALANARIAPGGDGGNDDAH